MDPFLLILIGIGIGIPLIAKAIFHHSICWKEWLLQTAILVLLLGGSFMFTKAGQISDVRVVNGAITSKERNTVSCTHSYECRCYYTGTGDNRRRTCSTCYRHSVDYDWLLRTTVGTVEISRIDSQGSHQPPRYTQATIGDPVAQTQRWTNYVQGAPHSVFNEAIDIETWRDNIPVYPEKIYDYHYLDRVLTTGTVTLDTNVWSKELAILLRDVRNNVVVVVTDINASDYVTALERAWLRGNDNDTVVVLYTEDNTIARATAFGWGKDPLLYIELREALVNQPLDINVLSTITNTVKEHFHAHDETHFAYLKGEVEIPGWAKIFLLVLTIGLSTGTTWFFHKNETFQ